MDPLGAEEIASQSVSSSQLVAPSLGASNSSTSETQALNASAPEDQYEIDLGTAWVIFTSDWDNETPGAELVLVTPGGVTLTEADIEADPNMAMVNDLITDRRRAVMVTGPEAGVWTVRLENAEAAGEVRFMALRDVAGAAVSITSTSGGLLGTPVRIDYQAFSEDPGATVSLYYDSDDSGLNGSLIAHGLPAVDGSYDWGTSDVSPGDYYIYAVLVDAVNVPVTDYAAVAVMVSDPVSIAGRHVFYNSSAWDANDPEAGPMDDVAIATDKVALLPGETATSANHTSYSRGINGIMIDVEGLAGTPSVADFAFKAGDSNDPSTWATAATPTSITVRPGEGEGGSDRVTIIWADNAIQKQWLQVTILSDANGGSLGMPDDDVFYVGNLGADFDGNWVVDDVDLTAVATNWQQPVIPLTSGDADCSGFVDDLDLTALAMNWQQTLTALSPPITPASRPAPNRRRVAAKPAERPLAFEMADRRSERVVSPMTAAGRQLPARRGFARTSTDTDGVGRPADVTLSVQLAASGSTPRPAATSGRVPETYPRAILPRKPLGRARGRAIDTPPEDILSLPGLNVSL